MSVLSVADIADLRAVVSALFPNVADVYHRVGAGASTYGGSNPTYPGAPDIAAVPVLYGTRSASEMNNLAAQVTQIDQAFTFPGGVDIRQTDRLIVDGVTWEVVAIAGGGAWEVTKPVGCRRVV